MNGRELIVKLSLDNPIVYNYLAAYNAGWITYEEALIGMVSSLVNHNDELTKLRIKQLELSASPMYFIKGDIK